MDLGHDSPVHGSHDPGGYRLGVTVSVGRVLSGFESNGGRVSVLRDSVINVNVVSV